MQELSEAGTYLNLFGGICGFYYEEWESGSTALSVDNKGHIYMLVSVIGESVQERTGSRCDPSSLLRRTREKRMGNRL